MAIYEEPNIPDSKRIRRNVRIGYKAKTRSTWNYYVIYEATCDQVADEIAKRILLGNDQVSVKILDSEKGE